MDIDMRSAGDMSNAYPAVATCMMRLNGQSQKLFVVSRINEWIGNTGKWKQLQEQETVLRIENSFRFGLCRHKLIAGLFSSCKAKLAGSLCLYAKLS